MKSQAVVIQNNNIQDDLKLLSETLLARINAVLRAENSRYIMMNSPAAALDDIQGHSAGIAVPTVMPLQGRDDMVAVHAVCEEEVFWSTMEDLKARGRPPASWFRLKRCLIEAR